MKMIGQQAVGEGVRYRRDVFGIFIEKPEIIRFAQENVVAGIAMIIDMIDFAGEKRYACSP